MTDTQAATGECPDDGLARLAGFPFPVAVSCGQRAAGMRIAARARTAHDLLQRVLGFTPRLSLAVLDRDDWTRHAGGVAYGVTHVAGRRRLVVGASPADAWQEVSDRFAQRLAAPAIAALVRVHGLDPVNGRGPALHALAETLVAHDLAHLVARQAGVSFPRRWLAEAFANFALVAALGESDPAGLRLVGSLADAAATLDDALPPLGAFDAASDAADVFGSVLAQLAITRSVYVAYTWAGSTALARMYSLFRGAHREPDADHELGHWLSSRVHPAIAAIPAQFAVAQRVRLAA